MSISQTGRFQSLEIPWETVTYCNAPFLREDQADNEGLLAWVDKAICEAKLGKTILFPMPMRSAANVLLESGVGVEMRSWGRVGWLSTITGKPQPSPPPVTLFILRGSPETVPAAASMGLLNGNAHRIVERLLADPENATAVWRELGTRLGLYDRTKKQEAYRRMVLAFMARLKYQMPRT